MIFPLLTTALFPLPAIRKNKLPFLISTVSSSNLLLVWNQLLLHYGSNYKYDVCARPICTYSSVQARGLSILRFMSTDTYSVSVFYNTNLERTTGKENG